MTDKQESIDPKQSPTRGPTGIHQVLEAAEGEPLGAWVPAPEEKKKILKARARDLARGEQDKTIGECIEVVEFRLAHEHYGIESGYVREITPLRELTQLPCTPQFVLGIINVRGQIVSVIDMKKFFDLPGKGLTDLNKVIIVHNETMEFGVLADAILGVRQIRREEIQPPLATFSGIGADYLMGVTKEPLVILNMAKVLSSKSLVVHEEMEV